MVLDGRAAIQQLQSVAEEFDKGKWEISTTANLQVAGVRGECHFILLNEMSWFSFVEEIHLKVLKRDSFYIMHFRK